MTTYLGYDVLEKHQNGETDTDDQVEQNFDILDNETGRRQVDAPEIAPAVMRPFSWLCFSRAEIAELRAFIDARLGRCVPFWVASGVQDFTATVAPGFGNTITIEEIGYTDHLFPKGGFRRHIWAWNPAFTIAAYRKVIGAVKNGDGTETLTLESAFSNNVQLSWYLGFLRLCRLEDDVPEIEFESAEVARCSLRMRELPQEAPA